MKLITETLDQIQYISEAKESGSKDYYIMGPFIQAEKENKNGRIYPIKVVEREVKRYVKESIENNRAYGELGHPNGPSINLDRVSHMIKELHQDGTDFIGKAKILDTPMGQIVKNLMDEGAKLGVSTRGMGSLKENKNGIMEVQDDFHLATAADIVADPSAPDAFVKGIMEGVEFWYEDGILKRKEIAAMQAKAEINNLAKTRSLNENNLMKVFAKYLINIVEK